MKIITVPAANSNTGTAHVRSFARAQCLFKSRPSNGKSTPQAITNPIKGRFLFYFSRRRHVCTSKYAFVHTGIAFTLLTHILNVLVCIPSRVVYNVSGFLLWSSSFQSERRGVVVSSSLPVRQAPDTILGAEEYVKVLRLSSITKSEFFSTI
jgi:hypothetical protein